MAVSLEKNSAIKTKCSLLTRLAWQDLLHDRKVALCIIFSLTSVIAPLLLLFGLKNGIITQLHNQLLNDPRNLEVRMIGNGNYPPSWFDELSKHPDIQFVIPQTRSLNTQADLVADSQHFVSNAEIIPTAKGDPLLSDVIVPVEENTLVLSTSAAEKLSANKGDTVNLVITRKRGNTSERVKQSFRVIDIISDAKFSRPAAFVPLSVLIAMEDYRDGYQVPQFNITEGENPKVRESFAKARVYANSLDGIAPINDWFNQQHIEVITQKSQIDSVKAITYVLNIIFSVIMWISLFGCIASLIGAFLANIDRKRKDMAVLRLLGFHQLAVTFYIIIQALLLTSIAFFIGFLLYLIGSYLFTGLLGEQLPKNAFVCRLEPINILIALFTALFIALCVAGIGALRAVKIQPAESLREI
ncbi:FtsX-like permease family protein [Providencia alcalifaciens]|uniref:ABC transporter permease n=1 Tax=Providencia alcalifaciens TaxID=126385 RepID=UPI001CE21447|nr:FtsX-like permease family protein [Providencia alcalifaciens]UBX49944.1 FtsX-like permease family protein [Providencia alcalifaciens]